MLQVGPLGQKNVPLAVVLDAAGSTGLGPGGAVDGSRAPSGAERQRLRVIAGTDLPQAAVRVEEPGGVGAVVGHAYTTGRWVGCGRLHPDERACARVVHQGRDARGDRPGDAVLRPPPVGQRVREQHIGPQFDHLLVAEHPGCLTVGVPVGTVDLHLHPHGPAQRIYQGVQSGCPTVNHSHHGRIDRLSGQSLEGLVDGHRVDELAGSAEQDAHGNPDEALRKRAGGRHPPCRVHTPDGGCRSDLASTGVSHM